MVKSLAVLGFVVGVVAGLLTRPSVPLLGQLPIETVLTRGTNLTGIDLLLKSTAETSFNNLLLWIVVCTAVGGVVGLFAGRRTGM